MGKTARLAISAGIVVYGLELAGCSQAHDNTSMHVEGSSSVVSSTTSSPTALPASTAVAAFGYTPGSVAVKEKRGAVDLEVTLPQLTGGNAGVCDRFNTAMRTVLSGISGSPGLDQSVQVGDGQVGHVKPYESSRVTRIGAHVVAGVLITEDNWSGEAHPSTRVGTVVINTDTAQPIALSSVFPDQTRAYARLAALAPTLNRSGEPNLTGTDISADADTFAEWVPSPAGLTVYLSVPHALGDFLPITYPWDQIRDLVAPGMLTILQS